MFVNKGLRPATAYDAGLSAPPIPMP
ncbi:MAG: hypothetical protein RIS90_2667, partial [Pseudomonadota bacterium]